MRGKKRWIYLCVMALFASIVWPMGGITPTVSAESAVEQSLDLGSYIRDLKMDEQRGYLYATTNNSNDLFVISMDSLQIIKKIPLGYSPFGMEMTESKLYVAVSGSYFIKVIDLDSQTVAGQISTSEHPYHIAINESVLYYSVGDQWSDIHRKDLATAKETSLNVSIHAPILKMDPERQLLYAAQKGTTASELTVFDATYGSQLWKWGSFYEISVGSNLLLDEGDLYSGGRRIDPVNRRLISTTPRGAVLAVRNGLVFTSVGDVYTKDEGIEVYDSGKAPENYSFIYVDANSNMYRNPLSSSVIKKIKFIPPTVVPEPLNYANGYDQIELDHPITAWVAGNNERYLYAISSEANRLLQIDTESFEIIADRYIGSKPRDIDIRQGVLYISLDGSSHIAKVDTENETNFMAPITEFETGKITNKVAAGDGKVFFSTTQGTVGVFDSVYSYFPGYYGSDNDLLYDESGLFVGDGGYLRQLNPTSGAIVQSSIYIENSNASNIIKDANFLYYGGKRLLINDLKTSFGPYKDPNNYFMRILSARDGLVLYSTSFFDRDSFSSLYQLPFYPKSGYQKKDGSIIFNAGPVPSGTSEYDPPVSFRLLKYGSFEQMKEQVKEDLRPSAVYAIDNDLSTERLKGSVVIYPGKAAIGINKYRIRYYDANNQKINEISDDYATMYDRKTEGYFLRSLYQKTSPAVSKIGIAPVQQTIYDQNKVLEDSERIVRIWDEDSYFIDNGTLFDSDNSPDSIDGRVTFSPAKAQMSGEQYAVFFYGDNGVIDSPIGWLPSGQGTLTLNIPAGTTIPADAYAVAVVLVDHNGNEAPGYSLIEIPDRMTLAPSLDQITVINTASSDTVSVSGLKPGDLMQVYSNSGLLYGQALVPAGSSSAVLSHITLDESVPVIAVSITSPGKRESFPVYKEYTETGSIPGGGGGSSGGGTGSGGGSGSGGSGGGGGAGAGGGLVISPVIQTQNSAKMTVTEIVKNADGTVKAQVKVSDNALDVDLSKWTGSASRLLLQIPDTADEIELSITGGQLNKITAKDATAVIEVQGIDKGFLIPVSVLKSAVGSEEQSIVVLKVAPANNSSVESANKLLGEKALNAIGHFYEFSITVKSSNGTTKEIKNTDQYIGHIFYIPLQTGLTTDSLSAFMVDINSGQIVTVPATFMQEGDKIKTTAYRKGNSIYGVVAGQPNFKDVPEAYFAKTAIGKLGARKIVSGYTDGSFKPEGMVSRAEAASILVKALGLTPSSQTLNFKDIKSDAWYAGSVGVAVQSGLFKGYPDGTFRPDQTITQQEMISILYQALTYGGYKSVSEGSLLQFDASTGFKTWSSEAVNALIRANVIKTGDVFPIQASKKTTRAESALLIYRLLNALKMI
ncbi:S-layer homology domain-containing protein [Paenibacillus sp. FSL K6-0276]|uniref:S-layer homology domain-containing protein n=1 Tax=Paenibacillus sp. FSL K6-0276 TaxID=2921450 RepID=UPI0030EF743E